MRLGDLRVFGAFLVISSVLSFAGCSGKSGTGDQTVVPNLVGPELGPNEVPPGTEKIVAGPNESNLRVVNLGTQLYLEVEGTLSNASYSQLRSQGGIADLQKALDGSAKAMKNAGAIILFSNAEAAYLSFYLPYQVNLLSRLKNVKFNHEFYFSPVHYDTNSLSNMKTFRASNEGFTLRKILRDDTSGFSGLERMNAVEFAKKASAEIGEAIDGSSVKVGITDTGITYNHPTFLNAQGVNRIAYMKDFTREGRAYFNPAAKFQATELAGGEFEIIAEALVSPKLPVYPNPEKFTLVDKLKVKVSPEIKTILGDASKKVVMGYLSEDSFNAEGELADINANGKTDDLFPMFYVVGVDVAADRVYIDFSAKGDFTNSAALGNFNTSGDTMKVYSERVGFELKVDGLPKEGAEELVPLRSASIVGFDPGNHGSHVAGIASGRKTIASEPEETLARGVAPNSKIYMDRVCANNGGCGTASKAIVDLVMTAGVDVVNMSLGGLNPFNDGYGVQETIVNRLVSLKNAVFMISAGNAGPGRQTLGSPSSARLSLSIGASASRGMIQRQYQYPGLGTMPPSGLDDDFMLFFSSRGPTANGGFKPNIVAPGTELSAVQLNAAPGARSGLDVYWGTSMAAPSATGAYALLLDAVKKFNLKNPQSPLATDAMTLRQVLIGSARKFGKEQYSWIDQGTGIIDLVAAWETLKGLRTDVTNTGVKTASGKEVPLDYQVLTSFVAPNGIAYNGSRAVEIGQPDKIPAFGSGLYIDANGAETFMPVYIARRLTEEYASTPEAGDLEMQLKTTAEEFVLKSDFGNDPEWFKAGTLAQIGCASSPTENLTVLGRGAEITRKEEGTGEINPFAASTLNVCIDRVAMKTMKAGDHGALIYAYRTKDGQTATVPSFVVPVYFTQVHEALAHSTAYSIQGKITSFGVDRNYVAIPVGTTVAQITLEVEAFKEGGNCSGVELMALFGGNTKSPEGARATRRISNCNVKTGAPELDPAKRKLVITRANPIPGIWDIDIFGQYQFAASEYSLRVDYIVGETSVKEILGTPSTLKGSFQFAVKEASVPVKVDGTKSTFELSGLFHQENSQVAKEERVIVGGPLGQLRQYPAGITSVNITTGGSPGNDIDLDVLECPLTQTSITDFSACETVGESGGATDIEKVVFEPKADKKYAIRVAGYAIKDEGRFFQGEELVIKSEAGTLVVSGAAPLFDIAYDFTASIGTSAILNHSLFTSGQFKAQGSVKLASEDGTLLGAVRTLVSAQ